MKAGRDRVQGIEQNDARYPRVDPVCLTLSLLVPGLLLLLLLVLCPITD